MQTEKIYVVRTEGDCEGKGPLITVGYAKGNPEDIKAYFDDKKEYFLHLSEAQVVYVKPEAVRRKREILDERKRLKERVAELDAMLK